MGSFSAGSSSQVEADLANEGLDDLYDESKIILFPVPFLQTSR